MKMANIPNHRAVGKEPKVEQLLYLQGAVVKSKGLYRHTLHRAWHSVHVQTWKEIQDTVSKKEKRINFQD